MEQKILSLKDDKINSEVELFEYPEELIGGRNLAIMSQLSNTVISVSNGVSVYSSIVIGSKKQPFEGSHISINEFNNSVNVAIAYYNSNGDFIGSTYNSDGNKYITSFPVTRVVPVNTAYISYNFKKKNTSTFPPSEINIIKVIIERGTKISDWTPAPEDLNLSYPDFITEFKPSISDRYILTEELIEYPEELRGGRNYFIKSYLTTGSVYSLLSGRLTPVDRRIWGYSDLVPYDAENITISQNEPMYGIGVSFWDENEKLISSTYIMDGNRYYIGTLKTWSVPPNTIYIRVNINSVVDNNLDNSLIMIEKGSTPTPWTPAPEDLGLSYPDNIQSFGTSFSNNILINEFIEQ